MANINPYPYKFFCNPKNNPKNQPKEKKIQCEFFDMCKHKYTNENAIKYHCNDIKSLEKSYAYCIIRKKVYDILEGSS